MLKKIFPFTDWFRGYTRTHLKADAMAGLTVALVLIPQSMAYAQLAGLPAYYGLYASFLPPIVAALFGSSRQLATGPVAVVSLMTAASLAPLATAGSEAYIGYAILLSLMIGLFQLLLGVLRLGLVVNFLSHPVIIGFTNAAALIIASSQLSKFFGVVVDTAPHHYETMLRVIQAANHYTHWPTLLIGLAAFTGIILLKKYAPRLPNVLIVVTAAIVLSAMIDFEHNQTTTVANIRSPKAKNILWTYHIQSRLHSKLVEQRSTLTQKLAETQSGSKEWIMLLQKIDMLSHKIRVANNHAATHRNLARSMLFHKVEDGEAAGFYLRDELPQSAHTDSRTWRVKVSPQPEDTENFTMIGGGSIVGTVPKGLPGFSMPQLNMQTISELLSYAVIIAIIGFMEAISIAKAMAVETGDRLNPNQELIGQGLGNIIGAMGQSYPTSGSFSRSAVNLQAGAVSGMASVLTGLTVVVVLLFLTPLLYHLPQSVLAAIIMLAVLGLINVKGLIHSWKAQWYDGAIVVITFFSTLYFAPHLDKGILIGAVLSIVIFLYKSMRPQVVSLSRGEDQYLHGALSHGLQECKYIDVVRFEGALFFANAGYLEDKVLDHMESKTDLNHIIIESSGISTIDASGIEALKLIVDRVRRAGITISFSGVHRTVTDVLIRTGMIKDIGIQHFYPTMEKALNAVYADAHKDHDEAAFDCPLKRVIYTTPDKPGGKQEHSYDIAGIWKFDTIK